MIEITSLHHRILEIPSLTLPKGHTALIGHNGAGKTTLLRLCAGTDEPESGCVTIDGNPPRSTEVGWVDELPDRTLLFERVADELASPLRFRHIPCEEIRERVRTMADRLEISPLILARTSELSAGEKVLVSLGAALIVDPSTLILDECDSHLDEANSRKIRALVNGSGARHILFCTQCMDLAANADQVLYLEGGKILAFGSPEEVFPRFEGTCSYPLSWRLQKCR